MKRFALAFSVFLIWLAIASSYYVCIIKGLCTSDNSITTTESISNDSVKPKVITETKTEPTNTIIEVDSLNEFSSLEAIKDSLLIEGETTNNQLATTETDTLKASNLKIFNGTIPVASYYGNFKIYKDTDKVKIPFGISEYGYAIAKQMEDTDSSLQITGYQDTNELENIGIQRANTIKERLIKFGIPAVYISVNSKKRSLDFTKYNTFKGGIEFNFKKLDTVVNLNAIDFSLKELPKAEPIHTDIQETILEKITIPKPIITPPKPVIKKEVVEGDKAIIGLPVSKLTITSNNFRNNKFRANTAFRSFIKKFKPGQKIYLTGYSNLQENAFENYQQGLSFATKVKTYLLKKGFSEGDIKLNSLKKLTKNDASEVSEGVHLKIQ